MESLVQGCISLNVPFDKSPEVHVEAGQEEGVLNSDVLRGTITASKISAEIINKVVHHNRRIV